MEHYDTYKPKLSVIIPCFNEVRTIDALIRAVLDSPLSNKEIIVVDDLSTDGTREKLLRDYRDTGLIQKVILHDKNMGKGAALRTGLVYATGEIVIFQDADLEYDPREYAKIVSPIVDGLADVVYGSRFLSGEPHRVLYFWHRVANGLLTVFSNMMTNLNLTDMETCYKAFNRATVDQIQIEENGFGVEPEITAKLARLKCRIYEVGISYHGRTYSEGKKIGLRDAFRALICILKYNLRP